MSADESLENLEAQRDEESASNENDLVTDTIEPPQENSSALEKRAEQEASREGSPSPKKGAEKGISQESSSPSEKGVEQENPSVDAPSSTAPSQTDTLVKKAIAAGRREIIFGIACALAILVIFAYITSLTASSISGEVRELADVDSTQLAYGTVAHGDFTVTNVSKPETSGKYTYYVVTATLKDATGERTDALIEVGDPQGSYLDEDNTCLLYYQLKLSYDVTGSTYSGYFTKSSYVKGMSYEGNGDLTISELRDRKNLAMLQFWFVFIAPLAFIVAGGYKIVKTKHALKQNPQKTV